MPIFNQHIDVAGGVAQYAKIAVDGFVVLLDGVEIYALSEIYMMDKRILLFLYLFFLLVH